jgi:hypothetical protein
MANVEGSEVKYEEKYRGLIYCHNAIKHGKYNERLFPQVKDLNIDWVYIDTIGNEADNQIIGSMFDDKVINKAYLKQPEGYDYILISACPIFGTRFFKHDHLSILASVQMLLKPGGMLIFPHFPEYVLEVKKLINPHPDVLAGTIAQQRKIAEQETAAEKEERLKRKKEAVKIRTIVIDTYLADPNFLTTVFNPYIRMFCEIFGFSNAKLARTENSTLAGFAPNYIYFYK